MLYNTLTPPSLYHPSQLIQQSINKIRSYYAPYQEVRNPISSNSSFVIFWILPAAIFRACMALRAAETFLQQMKMGAVQPKSLWKSSTRFIPASSTMFPPGPSALFMSDITLIPLPSHFTIQPNSFIQYSAAAVEVNCTNSYRDRSRRSQMAWFYLESGSSSTHMKISRSKESGVGIQTTHASSKSAPTSTLSTQKQDKGMKSTSSFTPDTTPTGFPLSDFMCRMVQFLAGRGGRDAGLALVDRKDWMQIVSPRFQQNSLKRNPGSSLCVSPTQAGKACRLVTNAEQQEKPCNYDGFSLHANFQRQFSSSNEVPPREYACKGWQKAVSPSPNFAFMAWMYYNLPSAAFTPTSLPFNQLITELLNPAAENANSGPLKSEGQSASLQYDLMTQQLMTSSLKTGSCYISLSHLVGLSRCGPTRRAQLGRASGTKAVRNCSTRISLREKQFSLRQSFPWTRTQSIFFNQKRIILETVICYSPTYTILTRLKFLCNQNSPILWAFSISVLFRMRIIWSLGTSVSAQINFFNSRTSCSLSNLNLCSFLVFNLVTTIVCSAIWTTSNMWQFLMSWIQSAMLS